MFRQIYITLFNLIAPSARPLRAAILALWKQPDGSIVPICLDARTDALYRAFEGGFDPTEHPLPWTAPAGWVDIVATRMPRSALIGVALLASPPGTPDSTQVWIAAERGRAMHIEYRDFQFTGTMVDPWMPERLHYPVFNGLEQIRATLRGAAPIVIESAEDQRPWAACDECGFPENECGCP